MSTVKQFTPLAALGVAKWSFSTRRVRRDDAVALDCHVTGAEPGDLILCRVEAIGSHKRVQLASGRPSQLYPGDLLVLSCGARYAPDQFEGLAEIDPKGADMLAGGGLIGRMRAMNDRVSAPTRVIPLGVLIDERGGRLNLARYALGAAAADARAAAEIPLIVAVGSAMNAGKTTAVAHLANGLVRAGFRVAGLKATGTSAFGDINAYLDAGVAYAADFVDAGMGSTYGADICRIEAGFARLQLEAAARRCDVMVVELADGVFQAETAALLSKPAFQDRLDLLLCAAPDAAAVVGASSVLARNGLAPDVVSGLISRSPMACAEAKQATGLDVTPTRELRDPAFAGAVFAKAQRRALARQRKAQQGQGSLRSAAA